MKNVRNLLTAVCFILVSNFGIASDPLDAKNPESSQIHTYLKGIDFSKFIEEGTKVNISFMVNGQNEILVVSTNNKDLDRILKSTLNYKKLNMNNLEYQKIYTVPVVIK